MPDPSLPPRNASGWPTRKQRGADHPILVAARQLDAADEVITYDRLVELTGLTRAQIRARSNYLRRALKFPYEIVAEK